MKKAGETSSGRAVWYSWKFAAMRWLMIVFAVSLVALLVAAAGVARHILVQHAKHRRGEHARLDASQESDLEVDI